MKKEILLFVLVTLMLLTACSSNSTQSKRVKIPKVSSPTAAVVNSIQDISADTATQEQSSPTQVIPPREKETAAQALAKIKETPDAVVAPSKSGTFYPPITSEATGADALKEKTRALFQKDLGEIEVVADTKTGARYADGLPGEYGSGGRFDD